MNNPPPVLVESFVQPTRLKIVAALSCYHSVRFKLLKEQLGLSDSLLSKHVALLKKEQLVSAKKVVDGDVLTTWLSLTSQGRKAFAGHMKALQRMADEAMKGGTSSPDQEETPL